MLASATHAAEPDLALRLRGPRVGAHRGGYSFPDSNTVERFEMARRQGADIVETDLQLSSDGVVFLFHDGDLGRATDCPGPLSSYAASAIERCRLNGLRHGPERFETALAWSRGRVVIDAELKSVAVVRPAIELVRRYDAYEWVYFQARNGWSLYREARACDSRVALEVAPVGRKAAAWLAEILALRDPRLLIIQLHPQLLTPDVLASIRSAGKLTEIDAWHVGSERLADFGPFHRSAACDAVFRLGIDIAISNDPRLCALQRELLVVPALGPAEGLPAAAQSAR
jgi:glycerophosphoryl diester phosphodiesterase